MITKSERLPYINLYSENKTTTTSHLPPRQPLVGQDTTGQGTIQNDTTQSGGLKSDGKQAMDQGVQGTPDIYYNSYLLT